MWNPRVHLAVAMLACALMAAEAREPAPASSAVVNGLQMSISHDDAAQGSVKALQFVVMFRNITSKEMTITPGTTYNCGHEGSNTDQVRITLTEASGVPHRHLMFLGSGPPYAAGCTGQIDFFEVRLKPGESIMLPLDLTKYLDISNSRRYVQAHFPAGAYSLQMELTGPVILYADGRATPPGVWVGTVTSNVLQVHFDKEFAACVSDMPK